jgi:hypothetical protein
LRRQEKWAAAGFEDALMMAGGASLSEILSLRHSITNRSWAAAGSVDTDLSFLSLLELYGTEIDERRMPTPRVVEALDVVEHI